MVRIPHLHDVPFQPGFRKPGAEELFQNLLGSFPDVRRGKEHHGKAVRSETEMLYHQVIVGKRPDLRVQEIGRNRSGQDHRRHPAHEPGPYLGLLVHLLYNQIDSVVGIEDARRGSVPALSAGQIDRLRPGLSLVVGTQDADVSPGFLMSQQIRARPGRQTPGVDQGKRPPALPGAPLVVRSVDQPGLSASRSSVTISLPLARTAILGLKAKLVSGWGEA